MHTLHGRKLILVMSYEVNLSKLDTSGINFQNNTVLALRPVYQQM